jgi:hypothetical protein
MKFQPGQSGNPAGRPLALALPNVSCADDAQVALNTVIEAFGRGEITVREFSPMLGSVDRMARVAECIQQNRAREHERYKAQRVHGIHPSMIPKPTSEPDRLEPILAAIERGEDPFPDDPVRSAYVVHGEDLYSPVNSDAPSLPRERSERGEGGSPERPAFAPCGSYGGSEVRRSAEREGETGGGTICCSEHAAPPDSGGLYSPVNSGDGAAEEEPAEAYMASSGAVSEAAAVSGFPSPARSAVGEGSGVRGDVCSEQKTEPSPGAADPARAGGMGEADGLYFSVNSGAELSPGTVPEPRRDEIAAPVAETATETPDPGAATICCSERASPPTPDPSPPFAARMGGGEPRGLDINPG